MLDLEKWKIIKKEKKLTIAVIAERAELPKGTVQNIFCGYVPNPRIDTVRKIEKVLGIYEESPNSKNEASIIQADKKEKEYILSEDEKILIDYYRLLVPVNKMTVFNLLQSVFKETKDIPVNEVQIYLGLN